MHNGETMFPEDLRDELLEYEIDPERLHEWFVAENVAQLVHAEVLQARANRFTAMEDMTGIPMFCIDGEHTVLRDDAVYITPDGRVGVAITLVSDCLTSNEFTSHLLARLTEQSETVYAAGAALSMMPQNMIADGLVGFACRGLDDDNAVMNNRQGAMLFEFGFNQEGVHFETSNIKLGWVSPPVAVSYAEALTEFTAPGDGATSDRRALKSTLLSIRAGIMQRNRDDLLRLVGEQEYEMTMERVQGPHDATAMLSIGFRDKTLIAYYVEFCMVAANRMAGRYAHMHGIDFIYRRKDETGIAMNSLDAGYHRKLPFLAMSNYYGWVTSPGRRDIDLRNQRNVAVKVVLLANQGQEASVHPIQLRYVSGAPFGNLLRGFNREQAKNAFVRWVLRHFHHGGFTATRLRVRIGRYEENNGIRILLITIPGTDVRNLRCRVRVGEHLPEMNQYLAVACFDLVGFVAPDPSDARCWISRMDPI